MSVPLPTSNHHGEPATDGGARQRLVGGIDVSLHPPIVRGVILKVIGRGLEARPCFHASAAEEIPRTTASLLEDVVLDGQARPARMAQLATELSEIESVIVQRLLNQAPGGRSALLAFGVRDPGVWTIDPMGRSSFLGLCDAARLAETSGVNVIDDFPARDIAQRGYGRPLEAMPYWFLLAAEFDEAALVVDMQSRTTLTWLPPRQPADVGYAQLGAETLPGYALIEKLERAAIRRLGSLGRSSDSLEDLSIDDALLERWLADSQRKVRLHWRPEDNEIGWLLDQIPPAALADAASSRRLVRTAQAFLVQSIAERAEQFPHRLGGKRALLWGQGMQDILGPLEERLPTWSKRALSAVQFDEELLPAHVSAMLALLHIDQIPGNLPELTGASAPRVLGRLTPGSPGAWRRLLLDMTGSNLPVLALRRAV